MLMPKFLFKNYYNYYMRILSEHPSKSFFNLDITVFPAILYFTFLICYGIQLFLIRNIKNGPLYIAELVFLILSFLIWFFLSCNFTINWFRKSERQTGKIINSQKIISYQKKKDNFILLLANKQKITMPNSKVFFAYNNSSYLYQYENNHYDIKSQIAKIVPNKRDKIKWIKVK